MLAELMRVCRARPNMQVQEDGCAYCLCDGCVLIVFQVPPQVQVLQLDHIQARADDRVRSLQDQPHGHHGCEAEARQG